MLVLASSAAPTNATSAGPPAPPGDLYTPPRLLPHRAAGALIWAQRVPLTLNPPATVWRILYDSRSRTGEDIAVAGFAIVPQTTKTGQGRAVVASEIRRLARQLRPAHPTPEDPRSRERR
jgi:hypothetical protein